MKKLLTLLLLFFITLYTFPQALTAKGEVEKALLEKDVESKSKQKEKSGIEEKEYFVSQHTFERPVIFYASSFLPYQAVLMSFVVPDVATPPPNSRS